MGMFERGMCTLHLDHALTIPPCLSIGSIPASFGTERPDKEPYPSPRVELAYLNRLSERALQRPSPTTTMAPKYQEIAAIAQKRRAEALNAAYQIPDFDVKDLPKDLRSVTAQAGVLTAEELEIINLDVDEILQRIRDRKLTAVATTTAFCKAAAVAQKVTNCVTEVLFKEGLERAKFLDEYQEKTGQVVGPLHGLPISLKDQFVTPPHPSSVGMAVFANEPTKQESLIVTILRDLGAVIYVKTNVPTGMAMGETRNNIFGETLNPFNKGAAPGGSSGGEGALIAMKGSPLGVGSDIAGSIRIPSAVCNLYGLKPSHGRFSGSGSNGGLAGVDFLHSVIGPMCRSLNGVKIFAEAVCSERVASWNYDPQMLPIPWRRNVIQPPGRKLKIGILANDGNITPHPPISRAIETVRKVLTDAGHEVIDWEPIDHDALIKSGGQGLDLLGTDAFIALLEKYDEDIYRVIHQQFQADPKELTPAKLREMIMNRERLKKAYLERWMATGKDGGRVMDGIIAPVWPLVANPLRFAEVQHYVGYTSVFNTLDYAACTFPVTFASKSLDPKRGPEWKPLNESDAIIQDVYDPEFFDGTPVTLQLVGKRLEEEKVVEMVEIVSNALKEAGVQ